MDAEALTFIIAPAVPLFFPLAAPPIDDVVGVAVVVNGAVSICGLALTSLCPIPATRLPAGGGPTDRRGPVAFFVVLDRLDPSEDRRGSVVLGHHGFDGVEEHFGNEDVLLRHDEDVLIAHLGLQDLLVNALIPSN